MEHGSVFALMMRECEKKREERVEERERKHEREMRELYAMACETSGWRHG